MNKLFIILSFLFLAGCNSPDSEKKAEAPSKAEPSQGDPPPEMPPLGLLGKYHHTYFVALGENSKNKVLTSATFRQGGLYGKLDLLPSSYTVFLDDVKIPANKEYSNYSKELDPVGFEGKHTWKIVEDEVLIMERPFMFYKFKTSSPIPSVIGDKDIPLAIEGLPDGERVTVRIYHMDIENEKDWFTYVVNNNAITIRASDIRTLKKGTYKLRLENRTISPVEAEGKQLGTLEVAYLFDDRDVKVSY